MYAKIEKTDKACVTKQYKKRTFWQIKKFDN